MMYCKQCNKEFESRRSDAQYCSASCRVTFNRNNKCNKTVTDNGIDVTDKSLDDVELIYAELPEVVGEFEDLPADVQRKIEYMSKVRSEALGIDYEDEKAMRTARALSYLGKFPQYRHCRGAA